MRSAAVILAAAFLLGCGSGSSDADSAVKEGSGVAINPSGKPRTPEEEAYAKQMQQSGGAINDDRAKMAEARRKAGQ